MLILALNTEEDEQPPVVPPISVQLKINSVTMLEVFVYVNMM